MADTDAGILVAGEMRGRARMGRDAMTVRGIMVAACAQGRPLVAAVPGDTRLMDALGSGMDMHAPGRVRHRDLISVEGIPFHPPQACRPEPDRGRERFRTG